MADVARRTGLHRATVHRTLTILLQLGYVHKNQTDLLYTTGFYLHTFGYVENIIGSIKRHARRFMEQLLADTGGLTVLLGALEGNLVVICDAVGAEAERERVAARIGARYDAHATALGKSLMAYRPPDEIKRRCENHVLYGHAKNTIRSTPQLILQCCVIFAVVVMRSKTANSPTASAVSRRPLSIRPRGATCAIGVEGASRRLNDQVWPHVIERVQASAQAISDYIMHSDRPERAQAAASESAMNMPYSR